MALAVAATALTGSATGNDCNEQIVVTNSGRDLGLASGRLVAANYAWGTFEVYNSPGWTHGGGGTAQLVTVGHCGQIAVSRRGTAPNFTLDLWDLTGPVPALQSSVPHPNATSIDLVHYDSSSCNQSFFITYLLVGNSLTSTVEIYWITWDEQLGYSFTKNPYAPDLTSSAEDFGWDVDGVIVGNELMVGVGAPRADDLAVNGGRVEFWSLPLVTGGTWTSRGSISSSQAGAEFGTSVALDHDAARGRYTAVVGSPLDSQNGSDAGAVTFFEDNPTTGLFQQTGVHLGTPGTNLGFAIAMRDGQALAGAPAISSPALAGSFNLYEWDGNQYAFQGSPCYAHSSPGDGFGFAVALEQAPSGTSASLAAVSAPTHISGPRVAVFDLDNLYTWPVTDLGQGLPGILGGLPQIEVTGPSCLDPNQNISLKLTSNYANALTFYVIGVSQLNAPFAGGTMVPFPNVIVGLATNSQGKITRAGPYPPNTPLISLYFQFWITAPTDSLTGFTATNGVLLAPPS
jgi:hypothetical protein